MGTKSRETIYGTSVLAAAESAAEAHKEADRLALEPLPIATEYFVVLFVGVAIGYQQSAGLCRSKV
jgi:hypothetical protein